MKRTLLVIGDSNAGGKQPTLIPQTYPNAARIFTMPANNPPFVIAPAADPLIAGYQVGPGMACADEIIARSNDSSLEILIIARLAMQPILNSLSLYMLDYRNFCSSAIAAAQTWGPPLGVLMVQGLHDASADASSADAFGWPIVARSFRSNLRKQLANDTLPFVVCGFSAKPAVPHPNHDLVEMWIRDMEFDDPETFFLDCSHYVTADYHFSAEQQVEIGRAAGADLWIQKN